MNYTPLVLHVDDDPAILTLVARKLQSHNVGVISIGDPTKAIDAIVETGVRIVLLDIDMPGKNGLTLLQEIKQLDAGIQVIMCTGMVSMQTILQSTAMGAETCIFKPIVDLGKVTDAVDRAFEKIDRWWAALHDWVERKKLIDGETNQTIDIESQLLHICQSVSGRHDIGSTSV